MDTMKTTSVPTYIPMYIINLHFESPLLKTILVIELVSTGHLIHRLMFIFCTIIAQERMKRNTDLNMIFDRFRTQISKLEKETSVKNQILNDVSMDIIFIKPHIRIENVELINFGVLGLPRLSDSSMQ